MSWLRTRKRNVTERRWPPSLAHIFMPSFYASRLPFEERGNVEEDSEEGSVYDGVASSCADEEEEESEEGSEEDSEDVEEEYVEDDATSVSAEEEESEEGSGPNSTSAFEDVEDDEESGAEEENGFDEHKQQMKKRIEVLELRGLVSTIEKRNHIKQVAVLGESLRAKEGQIRSLTVQLRNRDRCVAALGESLHAWEVQARSWTQQLRHKELQCKEAEDFCSTQQSICDNLSNEKRALQDRNAQLSTSLAQATEAVSASTAELDKLKKAAEKQKTKEEGLYDLLQERSKTVLELEQVHDANIAEISKLQEDIMQLKETLASAESEAEKQKAKEEGLHCLIQNRDKTIAELRQTSDVHCRHLISVATLAKTKVGSMEQVQAVEQFVRNHLKSYPQTHESGASGVVTLDESGFNDSSQCSTSHDQSLPITIPLLPDENLPDVSTQILACYVGRIARKWYEVAHAMGVGDVAAAFQQTEQDPERKCLRCLESWIERGLECSWDKLLRVLCSLQLNVIAKDIQEELHQIATSKHASVQSPTEST